MVLLYRWAGRLTAKNGGLRPGQCEQRAERVDCDGCAAGARSDPAHVAFAAVASGRAERRPSGERTRLDEGGILSYFLTTFSFIWRIAIGIENGSAK